MLQIEIVNLSEVEETIANMKDEIGKFASSEMTQEFVDWQTEDMKRTYPNTTDEGASSIFTLIWPRSRKARPYKPRVRRTIKAPLPRLVRAPGERPILRPELFDQLCQRMLAAMVKALSWQSTSRP